MPSTPVVSGMASLQPVYWGAPVKDASDDHQAPSSLHSSSFRGADTQEGDALEVTQEACAPVFQAPPEHFESSKAEEAAEALQHAETSSVQSSVASSDASSLDAVLPANGSAVWGAPQESPNSWRNQNADSWTWNFALMAVYFSISEGTVTTPVSYATALLDPDCGKIGTGLMFFFVVVSSLLVGPVVVQTLGPKWGLVFGMGMDCIYAVLFALAVGMPEGSSGQWIFYMVGSLCSGIGSGIIWTAQGTFFAASVALVAQWSRHEERVQEEHDRSQQGAAAMGSRGHSVGSARRSDVRNSRIGSMISASVKSNSVRSLGRLTPSLAGSGIISSTYASTTKMPKRYLQTPDVDEDDLALVTAQLGGIFAAIYLAIDVCMKISASLLRGQFLMWTFADPLMGVFEMFVIFAVLGICVVFAVALSIEDPDKALKQKTNAVSEEDEEDEGLLDKLKCAFKLWNLPELWGLGFTNFTFGFSAGFMNGYINGTCTANNSAFGKDSIGALMALSSLFAAVFSLGFGWLSQFTGKGLVVFFGSLAFLAIPLSTILAPPDGKNDYWGTALIGIYLLQGLGRSVYESTNKAIFADFFTGPQSAGAFANCMMQNGLAFFLSFILQSALPSFEPIACIIIVLALLTVPGFLTAVCVRARRRRKSTGALLVDDPSPRSPTRLPT